MSYVLASAVSGSPNYDSVNDSLLNQGSEILTLKLDYGAKIDPVPLHSDPVEYRGWRFRPLK